MATRHSLPPAACRQRRSRTITATTSYRDTHLGAEKARAYDADLWDPRAAKGLEWILEQRLLAAVLASRPAASSALDFACGTGRLVGWLAERVPEVVGIDISADMLEVAASKRARARLVLGDVTTDPGLVADSFDLVTAFRFFLNAEPPLRSAVLRWMRDHVRPGGALVANFHLNPRSARGGYLRLRTRAGGEEMPMASPRQAAAVLEEHGFRVVDVRGYSYLPYRRDGAHLILPGLRRRIEERLAGRRRITSLGGSLLVVAEPA